MSDSQPTWFTPWARPAAWISFAALLALTIYLDLSSRSAKCLLGLIPALLIPAGLLLAGFRGDAFWRRGFSYTSAALLLAGAAQFTVFLGWASLHTLLTADFLVGSAIGLMCSSFIALIVFGAGWVNRDARRRGLNPALWTTVVLVIFPYLLGFILYLLVVVIRDQRLAICSNCNLALAPNLCYCTRCGQLLHPPCPHCGTRLASRAHFCGQCGKATA